MLLTLLQAVPAIGAAIAWVLKIYWKVRLLRAPKDKPLAPDDTPRTDIKILLRFDNRERTKLAGLNAHGFKHCTAYLYDKEAKDKLGKHVWVRLQQIGTTPELGIVTREQDDLADFLNKPGVTVIETVKRAPKSRRTRFALPGPGSLKRALGLYDPWVWTYKDIWEVERPSPVLRSRRLHKLRNRKLTWLALCFTSSYGVYWLSTDPIIIIALMLAAPSSIIAGLYAYHYGLPRLRRESQTLEPTHGT